MNLTQEIHINQILEDIQESAERTYGEANSFYRKEELYLKDIERRIIAGELSSEKDIYDECHAIASDLAKCCEMYLKALYIYEHNIPGNQISSEQYVGWIEQHKKTFEEARYSGQKKYDVNSFKHKNNKFKK